MTGRIILTAAAFLIAGAAAAAAHGSLAVGVPADVAAGGVAIGVSFGVGSAAEAQREAVQYCRSSEGVPASTVSLCKVVHTFNNACVSIAMDRQAGTAGFGWGAGGNSTESGWAALEKCRAAAGARASACRVVDSTCD
jgi:hypothetical protein